MKKKFVFKKKKNKFKYRFLFFIFLFILSIFLTFRYLLKSSIKIDDKAIVKLILSNSYNKKEKLFINLFNIIKNSYKPVDLLSTNYYDLVDKKQIEKVQKIDDKNTDSLIYIYNTHQTEEYKASTFLEGEASPTVMMNDYIMEDIFNKNNYKTLVEERNISDILRSNNWKYYKSYEASRIYLNDTFKNNPSLKYFIDVHRDSLTRDKTTVSIDNKSYAKIIFLIGLENPNYQSNLDFTSSINDVLIKKYPNLSKGIYKKGGAGVNGVYNQDNSPYTILVEIGGNQNTTDEVLNSTLAFCDAFMEVIGKNEG